MSCAEPFTTRERATEPLVGLRRKLAWRLVPAVSPGSASAHTSRNCPGARLMPGGKVHLPRSAYESDNVKLSRVKLVEPPLWSSIHGSKSPALSASVLTFRGWTSLNQSNG